MIAKAFPNARFLPALRRGNVQGAIDMGMAPGMLPGRVSLEDGRAWFEHAWGGLPDERGRDTDGHPAVGGRGGHETSGDQPVGALLLLGADPLHDFPDRGLAERGARECGFRGRGRLGSRRGHRARRRGAPGSRGARAARHHHQSRGADQPARPEAGPAGPGLAGLDDRRGARSPPRRRSRLRLGRRGLGRDRAAGPLPPGDHPGGPRRAGRRRRSGRAAGGPGGDPGPPSGRALSTRSPSPASNRSSGRGRRRGRAWPRRRTPSSL